MFTVLLITIVGLLGAAAGVYLSNPRFSTSNLASAGGGLLFGIALFWLVPEIADTSNWLLAVPLTLVACVLVTILDRLLHTAGKPSRGGVVTPLLIAAMVHSFLDGWAVRVVGDQPLANVAVPAGLALHKFPEGLALGWVSRRLNWTHSGAFAACAVVELATMIGGLLEPKADQAGTAIFGIGWTAFVLAVIAGSFLYLGAHAVIASRRKGGAGAVFVGTLLGVAIAAYVQRRLA